MSVTPQQIKAYERKLKQLVKKADALDDIAVRRVMRILRDARGRVAAALVDASGFDLFHLNNIMDAITGAFEIFTRQYAIIMTEGQLTAFQTGIDLVDDPLIAGGLGSRVAAMPQLGELQLGIMQGFSADLITNLEKDALARINTQLQLSMLGEQTPFQAMKAIGRNLKDPSTFRTIAGRAEAITRTEINRVLNLTTEKRQEQAAEVLPRLKKYWLWSGKSRKDHARVDRQTNPDKGGKPIPIKKDFIVGGERAKGPHDPRLSAKQSISCACRSLTHIADVKTEPEQSIIPG